MRTFHKFTWKEANFRICCPLLDVATEEIKKQRALLEDYILRCPEFATALSPLALLSEAPEIVCRMHSASERTGLGPMAAVAGVTAQLAAEAAINLAPGTSSEIIVENGGDIFLSAKEDVVVGLYAGENPLSGKLAFLIEPEMMPLAVCSSSSQMGHSLSFGCCDLATVVAKDAALADAAATLAGNLVKDAKDVDPTIKKVAAIKGISGVLVVKDDNIGLAGKLPKLIKHQDQGFSDKITRAQGVLI